MKLPKCSLCHRTADAFTRDICRKCYQKIHLGPNRNDMEQKMYNILESVFKGKYYCEFGELVSRLGNLLYEHREREELRDWHKTQIKSLETFIQNSYRCDDYILYQEFVEKFFTDRLRKYNATKKKLIKQKAWGEYVSRLTEVKKNHPLDKPKDFEKAYYEYLKKNKNKDLIPQGKIRCLYNKDIFGLEKLVASELLLSHQDEYVIDETAKYIGDIDRTISSVFIKHFGRRYEIIKLDGTFYKKLSLVDIIFKWLQIIYYDERMLRTFNSSYKEAVFYTLYSFIITHLRPAQDIEIFELMSYIMSAIEDKRIGSDGIRKRIDRKNLDLWIEAYNQQWLETKKNKKEDAYSRWVTEHDKAIERVKEKIRLDKDKFSF